VTLYVRSDMTPGYLSKPCNNRLLQTTIVH